MKAAEDLFNMNVSQIEKPRLKDGEGDTLVCFGSGALFHSTKWVCRLLVWSRSLLFDYVPHCEKGKNGFV